MVISVQKTLQKVTRFFISNIKYESTVFFIYTNEAALAENMISTAQIKSKQQIRFYYFSSSITNIQFITQKINYMYLTS